MIIHLTDFKIPCTAHQFQPEDHFLLGKTYSEQILQNKLRPSVRYSLVIESTMVVIAYLDEG